VQEIDIFEEEDQEVARPSEIDIFEEEDQEVARPSEIDIFEEEDQEVARPSEIDIFDDGSDPEIMQSYEQARRQNPDQLAETLSLSKKTGLSPDLVQRNIAEVKSKAEYDPGFVSIFDKEVPEAKDWAKNPNNLGLISDAPGYLSDIKQTMKGVWKGVGASKAMLDLSKIRLKQVYGETLTPEEEELAQQLRTEANQPLGTGGAISTVLTEAARSSVPSLSIMGKGAVGAAGGAAIGTGSAMVLNALPGLAFLPEELVTIPALAGRGGYVGYKITATVENFDQQASLIFDDLINTKDLDGKAMDTDVARGAAIAAAIPSAILDQIAFDKILKTVPIPYMDKIGKFLSRDGIKGAMKVPGIKEAFGRIGKQWAKSASTEGITEAAQQAIQIMAQEVAKAQNEGRYEDFDWGDAFVQVRDAGAIGFGVGGVYSTPGTVAQGVQAYRNRDVRTPEDTAAYAQNINEKVRGDVLFQRNQDAFHSLVSSLTPEERLYINPQAAMEAISGLTEEQQQQLFASVPDLQAEMQTAMQTGADVSIKKADYATYLAPHPQADALVPHIKLDPEDQSLFERQAMQEAIASAPDMAAQIQRELGEIKPVSPQEMYPAVQRVVSRAMQAVGRSRQESDAVGTLFARTVSRFAAPFGQNAIDLMTRGMLEFQALDENGQPVLRQSNIGILLDDMEKVASGRATPGIDGQMKGAIRVFGERMKTAGITPEMARQMDQRELLDRVFPAADPNAAAAAEGIQSLLNQEISLPNIELTGQEGQINVGLSPATDTISGIKMLKDQANQGDMTAHLALQQMASNALRALTSGLGSVNIEENRNTGLYGGEIEPSLGLTVSFDEAERPAVLAALAQFAQNFNQQQVHVRQPSEGTIGEVFPDGSFNTTVHVIGLSRPLTREEVEGVISASGLAGLNFNDNQVEIYYAENPDDAGAIERFTGSAEAAVDAIASLGAGSGSYQSKTERLWIYGDGDNAIPFEQIAGDIRAEQPGGDANTRLIAERYFGDLVNPAQQAGYQQGLPDGVQLDQAALQRRIAAEYEALPDNDMGDANVRKAYEELVKEVIEQYRALPLREVEALVKRDDNGNVVYDTATGDPVVEGEPYKNSGQMRRDVTLKNRMTFFPTTKASFGPPGVDFSGHPLLAETEFRDKNGYPLLANDLFRVVHDYYAHTLSPTSFGALGEEAAWSNHMRTIKSPWARWALTTETRGQNSWVNFNKDIYGKGVALPDRSFARQKAALMPLEYSLTGDDAVDAPVIELMNELPADQQNGSLKMEQRIPPTAFLEQAPTTLFQTGIAQRNSIGLYSAVEREINTMNLPQWKASKKPILTDAMRSELETLRSEVNATNDERYPRLLELSEIARKDQGVAKGRDVWQKVEKLPVKKEEMEWLGLQDYLMSDPDATFTREEVAEFIRGNGVQIEEVLADQEATSSEFDWYNEAVEYDSYSGDDDYYLEEIKEGGLYENEYENIVSEVIRDERSYIVENFDGDPDDVENVRLWIIENFADTIQSKVEDKARELVEESYNENPYYRWYDRNTEYEIFGNDDIGYSITTPDGRSIGGDIYSFSEAEIQAREDAENRGYLQSEDSPTTAKWSDYITGGNYDNYRERKLTLPNRKFSDDDFYNKSHFADANIVAFTRETDRSLSAKPPEDYNVDADVPDVTTDRTDPEKGDVGEKALKAAEERSREAVLESYKIAGKEPDEQRMSDFSAWETIIAENMAPILQEADKASIERSGMGGTYDRMMELNRKYRSLEVDAGEYRRHLFELSELERDIARQNSTPGKMARSPYARKKTFFIEEFQSDWHQAGRKHGYKTGKEDAGELDEQSIVLRKKAAERHAQVMAENPVLVEKIEALRQKALVRIDELSAIERQYAPRLYEDGQMPRSAELMIPRVRETDTWHIVRSFISGSYKSTAGDFLLSFAQEDPLFTDEDVKSFMKDYNTAGGKEVINFMKAAQSALDQAKAERYGVPDVPWKNDEWIALGMKRALVDAVEKGYKRFAWADAEVLMDRWSERYETLYRTQYDQKMPGVIKRITGIEPTHVETSPELRDEGYWYIDITPELEAKVKNEGFTLFQRTRGYINFEEALRKVTIAFTTGANLSTAAHEFSHFGVAMHRQFSDLARQTASAAQESGAEVPPEIQRIIDDWETLKKNVGATDDVFTVEQEEKAARLFEAYLREGKAPSESLRRVFARFRDWLAKIYKDVADLLGPDQLNDEVRGVFDRWLASDAEIEEVQGKNDALTQMAQNFGLGGDIVGKIADYVNSATMEAEERLYKELDKEQKARETDAYKRELEAMKTVVADEFIQRREYAIQKYMQDLNLKFLDGLGMEGVPTDMLSENDGEGVILPDYIAELFGYGSGQEMLRSIKKASEFDRAVDREARQRLLSKYPDMIAQGRIQNRAVDAIMNDKVLLAIDLMIKELGKAAGVTPVNMKQFAKVVAQKTVLDSKQADAGYAFRFDIARDKAMREALKASRAGDHRKAMIELQKSMVNQMVYKQLEDFKDFKDKAQQLFSKINGRDKNLAGGRDIDFIGAARYILGKFGLGQNDPAFDVTQWMADLNERDPDIAQDIIGMTNLVASNPKPAEELTVAEYKDIYNAIENIYQVARTSREIQIAGRKIKIEQAVQEATANIDAENIPMNASTQLIGMNKFKQNLSTIKASLRRVENWTVAMDGKKNGAMWKYVWRPISEAVDTYQTERNRWMRRLRTTLKAHDKRLSERRKIATGMFKKDGLGRMTELVFDDRMQMIGFLLHTGNESNLDKLLGGYGIEMSAWENAKSDLERTGVITEEDWKLVQELWDMAEELKPISQKAHKNLFGYRFDEIEATPVRTPYGTYRGGYWPAIVDTDQTTEGKTAEQLLEQSRHYIIATTGKGFTKGRVAGYKQPLKTDIRLASQHIDKVLRFSYLEPAVRNVSRVINNREFKSKVEAVDPSAVSDMLQPWLSRVATQTVSPIVVDRSARIGSRMINFATRNASMQLMGYNLVVAVQNFANIPASMHQAGHRNVLAAFAKYMVSPIKFRQEVLASSKMMQLRLSTNDEKIAQEIEQIANRSGKLKKGIDLTVRNSRIFMLAIDNVMTIFVWSAGYNKATKQGLNHDDAVAYADQIIRETQGAGNAKDISRLEASSPVVKGLMPFYSFFGSQANLIGTEFGNIMRQQGWSGSGKMFMSYLSLVAAPAFLGQMIADALRGRLPEDDDEDGSVLDDWLAYFLKSNLMYLTAMAPFFGQSANAIINSFDDNPMNDRISISPVVSMAEGAIRGGKNASKAFSGDDVNDGRLIADVASGVGFFSGLPLGQPARPAAYAAAVSEGRVNADTPYEIMTGILAGRTKER